VGSLLEVGTGFHPELTGRENIYLNGAILGMKKVDIQRNFDAIVDFAEVEKFIDTPVKHYSSGMYTRLAFSVAAHLEPEVLVVDEVLAVGDIGFQKKCLARMSDVAREGRTVIFVSHNMAAVTRLCQRAVWLEDGRIKMDNDAATLVNKYQSHYLVSNQTWTRPNPMKAGDGLTFLRVDLRDSNGAGRGIFDGTDAIQVCLHYRIDRLLTGCQVAVRLYNSDGQVIFTTADADAARGAAVPKMSGEHRSSFTIPGQFLAPGLYSLFVAAHLPYRTIYDLVEQTVVFEVSPVGSLTALDGRFGVVAPALEWRAEQVPECEQVDCSL
jgi:lipopolysaccharide transport system ATP-binding protein